MSPEQFVDSIRKKTINSVLDAYSKILEKHENEIADPYWLEVHKFYNKLDESRRQIFFKVVRQTEVDTISSILGLLDNILVINNQKVKFILQTTENNEKLNGELQEIFIASEYL